MDHPALERDLADIVGAPYVLTSGPDRLAYTQDCWPRGIILARGEVVRPNQPAAIVQPKDEREIMALVGWARRTGTALVPFGAGSGVCGGAMATGEQVTVDLKRLDRIVETRADDMTMRVQCGVMGMSLEQELERRGFTLGHYPSSIICSSVGGWLAARGAGQYSSKYGKIEDMVTSMRVITGAGEAIETAADPLATKPRAMVPDCGPDLTQLFVGSEGTLGFITEATLRLKPWPTMRHYRGFQFADVSTALGAMRELMQLGLRPAVVRLYDAFDSLLARRGSGKEAGRGSSGGGGGLAARLLTAKLNDFAVDVLPSGMTSKIKGRVNEVTRALLGRVLGQPMTLNALIDVLPSECLLIVGFEGVDPELTTEEAEVGFDLLARHGVDLGPEPGEHWFENRYAVSYKQSPMYDAGAFVDTMEVSTTWSNLERLYDSVRRALEPHVLVMAHFSHVYPEGSSIYFTFAGFGADLDETLERYTRTWEVGLDAVARAGGSIAHHHGVGISKAPWTHHDHPGGRELFEALGRAFDPDGILNPGKVWPTGAEVA